MRFEFRRLRRLAVAAAMLHAILFSANSAQAGDAERGRSLYQAKCAACHSADFNGVGPAHRGVFGRLPAQVKGYGYSDGLKAVRQPWSEATLDRWLADPEAYAPGQRMGFSVPDAAERADLIAYLKTLTAK